jgi:hypothetical protein
MRPPRRRPMRLSGRVGIMRDPEKPFCLFLPRNGARGVVALRIAIAVPVALIGAFGYYEFEKSELRDSQPSRLRGSKVAVQSSIEGTLPEMINEDEDPSKTARIECSGQTRAEITSILGVPSDEGDDRVLVTRLIGGDHRLDAKGLFYQRFRYRNHRMLVLLYDKESKRVVRFSRESWDTRGLSVTEIWD